MRALIRKEWLEHRVFIMLLYLLGALLLAFEWQMAKVAITPLAAWHQLLVRFGTLAAIVVPNRLVVREYGLGTQLFLETLPLSRLRVLLGKWLIGWGWLMLFFLAALSCVLWSARHKVDLDPSFVAMIGARSVAYLSFVYAAAFAVALTLRYRFFVCLIAVVALVVVDSQLQLPVAEWPPFYLVKDSMVLERDDVPWRQLGITLALGAGLLCASLLLAMSVRGALVIALARRMSARTRAVLVLVTAVIMSLPALFEKRTAPPPFSLQQAVSSSARPPVHVGWQRLVGGVPAPRLAAMLSADLTRMQDWLRLPALWEVSLVPDAALDPDEFQFGEVGGNHLALRAALGHPDLAVHDLEAAVRGSQLIALSPIYGWREDRRWLMWGFATWWGARQDTQYQAVLQQRAQAAARLLAAHGLDYGTALRNAAIVYERLGGCLSDAFAWRGVQALYDRFGEERFRALMQAALGKPLPDDVASFARVRATAQLLEEAGMPISELAGAMQQELPEPALGASTSALKLTAARLAGDVYELRYDVQGAPASADLSIRYKPLRPMETSVNRKTLYWAGAQPQGVVPASFAGGSRVLVIAEVRDAHLGCSYRLDAVRKEIR